MKITYLLAAATLIATVPVVAASAQSYGQDRAAMDRRGDPGGWDRNAFWQGAPEGPRERIDWLQQRINRGVADGSLDRREARRSQAELNDIRRMTMRLHSRDGGRLSPQDRDMVQARLDDLSRRIRWQRRDGGGYGYQGGGYPGGGAAPYPADDRRFATDYDAARDYRDDPRYGERRLGADDQVYRGSDGRYYCKRNDGTTGLIAGAVGGGVLGNIIDGGHNRAAGTLLGGALGALAGKAIDQNSDVRCR